LPGEGSGITDACRFAEIKQLIPSASKKILGRTHRTRQRRWELEGAELRIYFSSNNRAICEMLEGREALAKVPYRFDQVGVGRASLVLELESSASSAASASRAGFGHARGARGV